MKEILNHLFEHKSFNSEEARTILTNITSGRYNEVQIAAFMTAYCMRSVTIQELEGFRDAMIDQCLDPQLGDYTLIDLAGTGGDGKDTFNISTLSSFVVAGAGHMVAKHGNYGVSSGCGSSNVMEHLGFRFSNDPAQLRQALEKANICFLHAPLFHPAMKSVAPIRKSLGVKTFFNMLGPMVNPARPKFQSVGVFSLELARLYAYLYQKGSSEYTILHALDGYDEISLTGAFKTFTPRGEQIYSLDKIGFEAINPEDIRGGGSIQESANIFISVLKNEANTTQTNVVLCNSAIALLTLHPHLSFADCFYMAEESLLSGKAYASFKALLELSAQ